MKSAVKAVMVQGTRTVSDQSAWQPSTGKEITLANNPSLETVLQGALLLSGNYHIPKVFSQNSLGSIGS